MKRFFLFILILSAFVSCGSEDKCENVDCADFEKCNSENGKCELGTNNCYTDDDCEENYVCDQNNCSGSCIGIDCSGHGTCYIKEDSLRCECEEGFFNVGQECVPKICNESEKQTISCGFNGNGTKEQICMNNTWTDFGNCEDNDVCENGDEKLGQTSCDSENGVFQQICNNGQWSDTENCISENLFVTKWKTNQEGTGNEKQIKILINPNYTYNYKVDCNNDGVWEAENTTSEYICNYDTAGIYQVAITGTFPAIYSDLDDNSKKLLSVEQWGNIEWLSFNNAFFGCENFTIEAKNSPDLSKVTNMSFMFSFAGKFNSDIGSWNVSNVTDMSFMFQGATSFNQSLDSWDVSKVENMRGMFSLAVSFDKPLNNWNVSNVKNMFLMFQSALKFNQPLDKWNVSNVTHMGQMFKEAKSFNQSLNDWNVLNVSNMNEMFSFAESFNQPLDKWNTTNVLSMNSMFYNAISFNQNINSWKVSNVADMGLMFQFAVSFNQSLNDWNVSNVTEMNSMFNHAELFDQPLNKWDVSNVTDMSYMFQSAYSFNQNIGNWNVSNVIKMTSMFKNANNFNQDLSNWNVDKVTSCNIFSSESESWTLPKPNFTQCVSE